MSNFLSNPFSDANFFQFFVIFFQRLFNFETLVSDEIQIYVLSSMAIACSVIGTFLILRKMTMLANALSHTSLLGIVLSYLLFSATLGLSSWVLIIASLLTALITSLLTEFLNKVIKLQEDASIGLVFTSLFALGIMLLTLFAKDSHIGVELITGNVDALKSDDIYLTFSIMGINVLFITTFFKEFKAATFDPFLSSSFGFSPTLFKLLLILMTSMTTMCAFRAVGVLMVLAFLLGPPLIARFFTHSLSQLLIIASLIGVIASFISVALSRHILTFMNVGISTGGLTVCILSALYVCAFFFHSKKLKIRYTSTKYMSRLWVLCDLRGKNKKSPQSSQRTRRKAE